jgi:hypothetical protein
MFGIYRKLAKKILSKYAELSFEVSENISVIQYKVQVQVVALFHENVIRNRVRGPCYERAPTIKDSSLLSFLFLVSQTQICVPSYRL